MLFHVLKILETILSGRIVDCEMGEEQQGFRRGRGMADSMFTLRQLRKKRLIADTGGYGSGIHRS